MLHYDKEKNLLTFYKVRNPEMGERFNLLRDVQASYEQFLQKGVPSAMELVNTTLQSLYKNERHLGEITFSYEYEKGARDEDSHLVVYGKAQGCDKIRILDLPYMDNLGKLHFQGGRVKTVVNKLTSSNDISYDVHNKVLSLVLDKKLIRVDCSSAKNLIRVEGKKQNKLSLPELIIFLSHVEGKDIDVHGAIKNPLLQMSLSEIEPLGDATDIAMMVDNESGSGLTESLANDVNYGTKAIRDSLNAAVSLDRVLGEVLSRPVLDYPAGTYITPAILQDIKKNRINEFYIKTIVPAPTQTITGGIGKHQHHIMCTFIPKGTEVTPYLREVFPEYDEYSVVPEDLHVRGKDFDFVGKKATRDVLEFLDSIGEKGVRLGTKKYPYFFETEVIGNHTVMYGDLYNARECKEKGVAPNDWMYYTGSDPDKLTANDLLALYSALGYMFVSGSNVFLDKDKDFLKKVDMSYEAMTKSLSKAIRSHVLKYRNHIRSYLKGGASTKGDTSIFFGLTETFRKQLQKDEVIDSCDTTNYIAEISQVTHLTKKAVEAPEVMRQIAIPYYGRICMFETPEGKQLGLVNNKAIGCHIVDGEMLVPVRKVHVNGDSITVSDTIEELTVRQEIMYRMTDILQLEPSDKPGVYKNTRVIAKVPNPELTGERLIYANIYASDLDYVYAHTEEFVSATTSLIPFACADDAVRVSFGSKMIKSAIYILDPDVPCVQTFMYRDIFNSSDAYLLRADRNGQVVDIGSDSITVLYDGDTDETEYKVQEFKITKDAVVLMRYKLGPGDRFKTGQILADCSASKTGVYCPGKNELIAYMASGYNYEDALHTCDRAAVNFISIGSYEITRKRDKDTNIDYNGMFKYYKRGEKITTISKRNRHGEAITSPVIAEHGSGIWYDQAATVQDGQPVYKLSLLGYNKLQSGDKMSGRHGNKGVISLVDKNSRMPMLANGTPIRWLLNPHGLPSRMNIGQVDEGHLGLCAHVLGVNMNSDAFNGASLEELKMMMEFTYELANTQSASNCRGLATKYGIPSDMIDVLENNMESIMGWAGTFDKNGDAYLWNPVTGKWFPYKVTIGVSTMLKMKQEAETKIHARAGLLEETYQLTTSQPPKGGAAGGGQGMGEMELWAIAAYGAANLLYEMCNTKSDNETERVNSELKAMGSTLRIPEKFSSSRAVTNMMYVLESFGLLLEDDRNELPDVSAATSRERFIYKVKELVQRHGELDAYETTEGRAASTEAAADQILRAIFPGM